MSDDFTHSNQDDMRNLSWNLWRNLCWNLRLMIPRQKSPDKPQTWPVKGSDLLAVANNNSICRPARPGGTP